MVAFLGKILCSYQTHENLTKGLKTNPNKGFVKKYKKLSDEVRMIIYYDYEAKGICERCLEFCKRIGQLSINEDS